MKKLYLAVLLLLTYSTANACFCSIQDLTTDFAKADFIGYAHITKTYPSVGNYYKIDIEPIEIFKGKNLTQLHGFGSTDPTEATSCDIDIKPYTTWLLYARYDKGKLVAHLCEGSQRADLNSAYYPAFRSNLDRRFIHLRLLGKKAGKIRYDHVAYNMGLRNFYLLTMICPLTLPTIWSNLTTISKLNQ